MKEIKFLQKQYPKFIYQSYSYQLRGDALHISFNFIVPPNIKFRPKVIIKNVSQKDLSRVGESALSNLVFHLGLMEMPSYWKVTASPRIIVQAGYLNKSQTKWWKDLFIHGMGQYFYENKMDFTKHDFLSITSDSTKKHLPYAKKLSSKILIPVGGGKDSIVTIELLKHTKFPIRTLLLNPKREQLQVLQIAHQTNPVVIQRFIDPKLLRLNRKGYLNGHTPFSAYIAFLSLFCGVLFDYKYVALSNERSSNEGNVKYLGRTINHQYSKSFDFEKKFRTYSKKYLSKNIEYFSFLRPLYELQIAEIFSNYPKYFATFLSCNEAHKTYSGKVKPTGKWCCKCSKCLFVFTILYPFVEEKKLVKIFGSNLFQHKSLIPLMKELVGERNFKPFECVGTIKESLAAFYLSLQKTHPPLPPLLKYFRQHVSKEYPNLPAETKNAISAWNNQHFVPHILDKRLPPQYRNSK